MTFFLAREEPRTIGVVFLTCVSILLSSIGVASVAIRAFFVADGLLSFVIASSSGS